MVDEAESLGDHSPLPQRLRKRTHRQISREPERTHLQNSWRPHLPQPYLHSLTVSNSTVYDQSLTLAPMRYTGDGSDCRRPVVSTPCTEANVIDLTEEPDSPQHPQIAPRQSTAYSNHHMQANTVVQEVIDLEEDDLDNISSQATRHGGNSPDIEVLGSNPIQRQAPSMPAAFSGGMPTSLPIPPPARRESGWFQTSSLNAALLPTFPFLSGILHRRPGGMTQEQGNVIQAEARQRVARHSNLPRRHHHVHINYPRGVTRVLTPEDLVRLSGFQLPRELDFETQGFQMGEEPLRAAAPTYTAPPSPRAGFTRSPAEDDVAICPNCDDELGIGDSDLKKQVWVIKRCGHVYCGACAKSRTRTKIKETRTARTKAFSRCVVDGCGKTLISSPKAMLQLFI